MTRRAFFLPPSIFALLTASVFTLGAPSAMASAPSFVADATTFEAAKKEGKVVYYCAQTQEICEYLGKRFEQLTGITAEVTRMPAGVQYDRIQRERQAALSRGSGSTPETSSTADSLAQVGSPTRASRGCEKRRTAKAQHRGAR